MSEMISVAEGFQYSVNIAYDLHADDKLKSYIPTQSALQLMEDILQSTLPTSTDRSRVLIGAYGKGKSHIVLTILALLMKRDLRLFEKLMPAVQKRDKLNRLVQNYYESNNKLLPVIITGSNTSLTQAFLLALQQTLKENDLLDIMPETNYKAAISVIERWKKDFPDTYQQFKDKISDTLPSFISRLEDYDIKAYEEFERIYPSLTAGSTFNPFVGFDVVQLYESVVQALKPLGYTGVYVIYDEFSKYLEANISEASVSDTKMLQDFAEKCNRSGTSQMHLMLISHKEIANYIDRLPKQKVDGWRGVSERFTHVIINEAVNKNHLTANSLNSRSKIVIGLLRSELEPNLGLAGSGQEVSILRSTLIRTGVLETENGVPRINLHPKDYLMSKLMGEIEGFVQEARTQKMSFSDLYERLTTEQDLQNMEVEEDAI